MLCHLCLPDMGLCGCFPLLKLCHRDIIFLLLLPQLNAAIDDIKKGVLYFPTVFFFFLMILLKWFLMTSKHWHEIFDFSYRKWKIWLLECFRAHDNRVYETGAELDLHRRTVDSAAFLNIFFLQCFHPQQQQHKQRVRE